jgi:glycosyltransferase involved in cell wall biosynthesis
MHILLVTNYFAPESGAAAVRLTRLARLLAARGHRVTVLTSLPHYPQGRVHDRYRGWWWVVEYQGDLRVVQSWLWATPSPKISRRLVSQVSFMLSAALRGLALPRPDVVLTEAQPVFTGLAGVWLSLIKRVPFVLNVSDFWPEYLLAVGVLTETHPVYRAMRTMVDFMFRRAAGIVTLYPPLAESVHRRIGPSENVHVIYNGVDLERFRPNLDTHAFREKYQLGEAKLVSFVGTFGTHIDFETMLEVAGRFNAREDVRFVFIGSGGQREMVRERLAHGDLSNARWVGWIDHGEMPLAWGVSHVTFWAIHDHPLYRQILQSKTYEAMACGVPMAVAVEGIGADIVERAGAGQAVGFGDVDGLVSVIDRLLHDLVYHAQCSTSARAYAEQHFDPERIADAYEDVLVQAVAQN